MTAAVSAPTTVIESHESHESPSVTDDEFVKLPQRTMNLTVSNLDRTIGRLVSPNGECVVQTSIRPIEITNLDTIASISVDFSNSVCILSYSGALVRLYFYEDRWCLSTHNKVNAYQSYYNNDKSFGDIFLTSIQVPFEEFTSTLDESLIYTYIVRDSCNVHEDRVLFAGAYPLNRDVNEMTPPIFGIYAGPVNSVPRLCPSTHDELVSLIRVLNKHKVQGILVFFQDTVYKIFAPGYRVEKRRRSSYRYTTALPRTRATSYPSANVNRQYSGFYTHIV